MSNADFERALGEADRTWRERCSQTPRAEALLRERVVETVTRHRRRVASWRLATLGVAAGAGACALIVFAVLGESHGTVAPSTPTTQAGAVAVVGADEASSAEVALDTRATRDDAGWVTLTSGHAVLREANLGVVLGISAPAVLRREQDGFRVASGRVRFDVRKRTTEQPPMRVHVSHGTIEVIGTRFEIAQEATGGAVFLEEGAIRFDAKDSRRRSVAPGQTLRWPLVPPPPPQREAAAQPHRPGLRVAPRRPKRSAPKGLRPDLGQTLSHLEELRGLDDVKGAVALLESALRSPLPAAARERLSFELGILLTRVVNDEESACAHWNEHRARHPQGRYAPEVRSLMRSLRCENENEEKGDTR